MRLIDALLELLGRLGACYSDKVLVNAEELRQWPAAAVKAMKSQKLIMKARPASSAICPGCERECVMPVYSPPGTGAKASFIVCDKRSDTNRVMVPAERLIQWQCCAEMVCEFVAAGLGLRRTSSQTAGTGLWEIGLAAGDKRSQMICLKANGELVLVAGDTSATLADLIEYRDGKFLLDSAMIRRMVDSATTADPRYTPSDVKREARKLDTQEMYESWRKKYRQLKRSKPGNSDNWYAFRISKMEIARGRNAETIRKKMKK
jgi:hypothetical protein